MHFGIQTTPQINRAQNVIFCVCQESMSVSTLYFLNIQEYIEDLRYFIIFT
jgi:hypothetical protein